jgi:hypothetical protein
MEAAPDAAPSAALFAPIPLASVATAAPQNRRSHRPLLRVAIVFEPPPSQFYRSVSFPMVPSVSPCFPFLVWWPIGPFYASSGELLRGRPWRVPLGSFSGRAKDLSMIALFPSLSRCLQFGESWSLGPVSRAPASSPHGHPWRAHARPSPPV